MRNSVSDSSPTCPVAAAHPITGGSAPAAPPMTIFCRVRPFHPGFVHKKKKKGGPTQKCSRRYVRRQRESRHCEPAQNETKNKRLESGDFSPGDWPHRCAAHDRIDIGVVPHVE